MKRLLAIIGMVSLVALGISLGLNRADAQDPPDPTPNPYQRTTAEIMAASHTHSAPPVPELRPYPGSPSRPQGNVPGAIFAASYSAARTSAATISEAMVKTLITTWQRLIPPPA